MIATHDAVEVALSILARRHKRLRACLHVRPMPAHEIHLSDWRKLIAGWLDAFPGSREEGVTETPRNTK